MSYTVTFVDQSRPGPSGPITAWDLDFGDGSGHGSGPGPWSHDYASTGTYPAVLEVTGTSPDGTATRTESVVVADLGGTPSSDFFAITGWDRPAFTPVRTRTFGTKAELDARIADMQPGDLIKYVWPGGAAPHVLTISSSSGNGYELKSKNPSGTVVFDFGCSHNEWDPGAVSGDYVAFRYTGTKAFAGFLVNACSNLRIFGGDYSTGANGGTGFSVMGATHDCYFWDCYSHDNGSGSYGFLPKDAFSGVNQNMHHLNIRVEAANWGRNPGSDTHTAAPGTGHHALLTTDAGGGFSNNTIAIYAHNPTTVGAAFEMGSQTSKGSGLIQNNTIYVLAEHFHFHSTQSCANAINLWGNKDLSTNRFGWIEGNDLYGTMMHSTGQPNTTGMVVDHGRHSSTNQNPSDGISVPYPSSWGIVYHDCT